MKKSTFDSKAENNFGEPEEGEVGKLRKSLERDLIIAAELDHIANVQKLIQYDPKIINGTHPKTGNTALITARSLGHERISEILIEAGADVNIKNNYGESAFKIEGSKDDGKSGLRLAQPTEEKSANDIPKTNPESPSAKAARIVSQVCVIS